MGSFLSRALLMVLGYAYPAYKCFKIVQEEQPQVEKLVFWCQYWILVGFVTVCERVADVLISWLPLYGEAKLVFFIYLWHHRTRGTEYIYNCFCRDFLKKHEVAIDQSLLELRIKAEDLAIILWQTATSYGLTRIFETLQQDSSQSPSLQRNDGVVANKEHQSDSRSQSEPEHQTKALAPSAVLSSDDGEEAPVLGRQFPKHSCPGNAEARDLNTALHGKMPSSDDGKLKGSAADEEGRKSGVFRAAMNCLRRRKSPR